MCGLLFFGPMRALGALGEGRQGPIFDARYRGPYNLRGPKRRTATAGPGDGRLSAFVPLMPDPREQQSRAPLMPVRGGSAQHPRLSAEAAGAAAVRRGAPLARPLIER